MALLTLKSGVHLWAQKWIYEIEMGSTRLTLVAAAAEKQLQPRLIAKILTDENAKLEASNCQLIKSLI